MRHKIFSANCANCAILAVLVILWIPSEAPCDAARDYEVVFGKKAKAVTATRETADDADFAAELLQAAGQMPDSPQLQDLLYEKACVFGIRDPSGYETVLAAAALAEKTKAGAKRLWQARLLKAMEQRFRGGRGEVRRTAGLAYLKMLVSIADREVAAGGDDAAIDRYNQALRVATALRSPDHRGIDRKLRHARARQAAGKELKRLQAALAERPDSTAVRQALVLHYVVERDEPARAAGLLTGEMPEPLRTYVPLAVLAIDQTASAACGELADWYRALAEKASVNGKALTLRRAKRYYARFLATHGKRDVQHYRATAAIKEIDALLWDLPAPVVAEVGPLGGGSARAPADQTLDLGPGVTMKLVLIPAGGFRWAGSDEGGSPGGQVVISRPFYMAATEVTQAQYRAVTGRGAGAFRGADRPVENVSWSDAAAFCKRLSKSAGRTVRLPTEAEWEYACRAGGEGRSRFGASAAKLDAVAWHAGNSGKQTHPVAGRKANAWGLHDMHGNVWEWCGDWYEPRRGPRAAGVDPTGPDAGLARVVRGGSWFSQFFPRGPRFVDRGEVRPDERSSHVGFRVVVEVAGGDAVDPSARPSQAGAEVNRARHWAAASAKRARARRQQSAKSSGVAVETTVPLDEKVALRLVLIPGGKFTMGSAAGEADRDDREGPVREVVLSRPFYLGVSEVTQAQWRAVMGTEPWKGKPCVKEGDDYPATYVHWLDAVAFCEKLSAMRGLSVGLPSEAQWECACRADSAARYHFGSDDDLLGDHAWYYANALKKKEMYAHRAAAKKPNAWGLYDMHGNVWEWCADWYGGQYYAKAKKIDPRGPSAGARRVFRGGSWGSFRASLRSANRGRDVPDSRGSNIGFRVIVRVK